jgi:hypothetical protein
VESGTVEIIVPLYREYEEYATVCTEADSKLTAITIAMRIKHLRYLTLNGILFYFIKDKFEF